MLVLFLAVPFSFAEPPDHVSREEQQLADLNAVAVGNLGGSYGGGGAILGYRRHERNSLLDFQR